VSRADTVGIVGAGAFGTALAVTLARAGRPVMLWSRDRAVVDSMAKQRICSRLPGVALPLTLLVTADPAELAQAARFVVLAVASTDVRARALELGNFLDANHIVVHAVGALAAPNAERVSEVVAAGVPTLRIGALAGPPKWSVPSAGLAAGSSPAELAIGNFVSMVVASAFAEVVSEGRRLLNVPPALRVYGSSDLPGVELASALAGTYAIGLGMADGLGVGTGARAVIVARAMAEAVRLGVAMGAQAKTFTGLAGLANLLVRADKSDGSVEYRLGQQLATGTVTANSADLKNIEGARAAASLRLLAQSQKVHVPLLAGIDAVLQGKLSASAAAQLAADFVAAEE
jgi:glycerol-3-phosphate dehydrogenase (NAD(P)+)